MYREIADSINDTRSLQTDIDRLATLWQLKFNLENCETMRITRNKDKITPSYTMGRFTLEQFFSKFLNVSGFIGLRVFGSVGVYTKRKFGFFTVYTGRQLNPGTFYDEMLNKLFVASTARNKMPPEKSPEVD